MKPQLQNERKLFARSRERVIVICLFACSLLSVLTTFGIIAVLVSESLQFFAVVPLTEFIFGTEWTPLFSEKRFGILPLLCGTLLTATIGILFALPTGLLIAVYLSEYASGRVRSSLKPILEILAGIPTIVFGYFALIALTPLLQTVLPSIESFNALSAGLAIGIMILPMIASLSESAIYAVPQSLKDGSYALGANRLQTTILVVLPAALGGISAGVILALARAIGETMIVAIAAGQQPRLSLNPLGSIETMTAYIVQVSLGDTPHGTLEYHTIFAVGLALFIFTLVLNMISIRVRDRFKSSSL